MPWDRLRHFIIQRTCWEQHILGPRAKSALTEPVNIVNRTHPVRAHSAILTFPTRHNLFADSVIADFQFVLLSRSLTQSDDFTDKFMSRSNRRLAIPFPVFISPEERSARVAFDIAGANP